jgi:hypothetical protein
MGDDRKSHVTHDVNNRPDRSPNTVSAKLMIGNRCAVLLIASLGAYINIAVFGFSYGVGNHAIQLPLVNWLRDQRLYPDDPIIGAFKWHASFFWPAVAYLSSWLNTRDVLFIFFVLTKTLFFVALTSLTANFLKDFWWTSCVIIGIALSPFFSEETPFGASDILNTVQTHTSLAIALVVSANVFLLTKRWRLAMVLLAITFYVNALFALYSLFAVAGLAVLDWEQQRREILSACFLVALLTLPWLLFSRGKLPGVFPENFFSTLLLFYPYHVTLQSHPASDWLLGSAILLATIGMVTLASKFGSRRHRRLELLASLYFVPVLLGAIIGVFPIASLVRLQLLRADTLLFLYCIIILQLYGVKVITGDRRDVAMPLLILGTFAVLAPMFLGSGGGLPQFVMLALLAILALRLIHPLPVFLLMLASMLVRFLGETWIPARLAFLGTTVSGVFLAWTWLDAARSSNAVGNLSDRTNDSGRESRLALGACVFVLVAGLVAAIPATSRFWNPVNESRPTTAWREVQQWAELNTPLDARFLVPPHPYGFRVFSKRSVWVDWKDGDIVYIFPEYAPEWRHRMEELGIGLIENQFSPKAQIEQYKKQHWDRLVQVASAHNLNYIVHYADVPYPARAVFKNELYAIYPVH